MTFSQLKTQIEKQEMLLRKYIGYTENEIQDMRLRTEIKRLSLMQTDINNMNEHQKKQTVPVHYTVIQSNINTIYDANI